MRPRQRAPGHAQPLDALHGGLRGRTAEGGALRERGGALIKGSSSG